jgi:hypothetical protein
MRLWNITILVTAVVNNLPVDMKLPLIESLRF